MIYFKNKDKSKNIGTRSGKKFVAEFEIKSYVLREDGTRELVKEDGFEDLLTFLKNESGELILYRRIEDIQW